MFPAGETVGILTAGTSTHPVSGETVPDWTTPSEIAVSGCGVEPRPSGEPLQDARNQITSGFTVYLPPGTAVTARNRARVRGTVYGVLGEPAVWRNPFTGWEPGVVIQVERTEG